MKKWMEWQLKNQVEDCDWYNRVWSAPNLYAQLGPWFENIVHDFNNNTSTAKFFNLFTSENHIKRQAASTKGAINENEYRSYLNEYNRLLAGMGHFYIDHFGKDHDMVVDTVTKAFKLIPGTIEIRLQIETPGQYFVMHIDRLGKRFPPSKVHVTFLQDQALGQIFMHGNKNYNWAKGDTVTWDYNVPHGSVNIGYENKFMLVVLGESQ